MLKLDRMALYAGVLFMVITASTLDATVANRAYPKGYIPFWSQHKGGHETALINTQQIVRIVPIYGDEDKRGRKEITHLDCYLSDGIKITIEEDFEEFYNRVRSAQSK